MTSGDTAYHPPRQEEGARRALRVPPAAWPVIVAVVAALAALVVGGVLFVLGSAGADDSSGWAELGWFVFGLVVGSVVFVMAYVAGLGLAARRAFPRGSRLLPWALGVGLPVVFAVLLAALARSLPADQWPPASAVAALSMLLAPSAAFAWSGDPRTRRRLAVAVASAVVLVVGVAGLGAALDRVAVSRAAAQLPLVVFRDGRTDVPYDGWQRDRFSATRVTPASVPFGRGRQAYLKYFTPDDVVFLTMHEEVTPCTDSEEYTCTVLDDLPAGQLRTYVRTARYGTYPRSGQFDVLVHEDGSAVSVTGSADAARPRVPSAVEVLTSVERVGRSQFEEATGVPLRLG